MTGPCVQCGQTFLAGSVKVECCHCKTVICLECAFEKTSRKATCRKCYEIYHQRKNVKEVIGRKTASF